MSKRAHVQQARAAVFQVAGYGAAHFALTLLGFGLAVGDANVPWFWPAAGLLPTAIAIARPRLRLPLLVVAFVAERLAALSVGLPAVGAGGIAITLANLCEAVFGATAVAALLASPWYRRTSVEILAIACVAALIVPLVGAGVHGVLAWLDSGSSATVLGRISAWWAADALGIVLINPLIGTVILWRSVPGSVRARHLAGGAVLLSAWLVLAFYLTAQSGAPFDMLTSIALLSTATLIIMMLAACTLPPVLMTGLFLAVALLLNFATRLPGTYMAQLFAGLDGPHLTARTLLMAGAIWCCIVALVRFERRYSTELAEYRRAPHFVLAELATRLAECEPDNVERRVTQSLATVGRTCGADRCVIFSFSEDRTTFSQTHRWCRPGVDDVQARLQDLPLDSVTAVTSRVARHGTMFVRASDVDPDSALGQYLELGQAWAVAYAPLRSDQHITGVLGLTWQKPTRRWGTDSSVVLQSAAQVIGRTLSRTRTAHADAAYRDKLRALTARLEQLDTVVRRETAADLHDGAAQSLAVARLRLARIRQQQDSAAELQAVEEMIVAALTEIRGVIKRMVPSALYELGLGHALREFVDEAAGQLDVALALTVDDSVDPLPAELAALMYRAARELVTNALKHASAQHVNIRIARSDSQLLMTVADDGRGFGARRSGQLFADGTGLGLFSLRERLARVGGTIEVRSDSHGTRATVRAPLYSALTETSKTHEPDQQTSVTT